MIGQGGLVRCFNLRFRPKLTGSGGETILHTLGETANHGIADSEHAVRHQHPLSHQLQFPHIREVLLVDESDGQHILALPHPLAAVNPLFHFQRVKGQVVVNHKGGAVQVEAPRPVVRGDQNFRLVPELPDRRIAGISII